MIDQELVRRIVDAEKRLERLQSREVRRFITDYDWHRGWKDDFLGDSLHEQYTPVSNGAGSGGTLLSTHGGAYRLTAGAGAGFYHYLYLGDAADSYGTLDADLGWVMLARMAVSGTTSVLGLFGSRDVAWANFIRLGIDTTLSVNWLIQTRTGGGAVNTVASAVPADTGNHWHAANVYPITGGLRQVDYYLDGVQIATTTISVPTAVLTPMAMCYAVAAASRYMNLDFWGTIPGNL